jgi:hypothetical protein
MHLENLSAVLYFAPLTMHTITLIVVSATAQCFLGALWYGVVFKKSWKKLTGIDDQSAKFQIFRVVASLVACFLLSFMLAHMIGIHGTISASDGAAIGIVIWFGMMGPILFVQHIFEGRPANLLAINACYWMLAMALGGAIVGGFQS